MHITNILKDKELSEMSVVKEYLTTAADGRVLDASGNSIWQSATAKLQLPDKQVIEIWQSKTAKLEE